MKTLTVGLIGNPNSGKTTLFNALTGARQKVGNWPGVTVEKKQGHFNLHNTQVEVVDLPGIYSLTSLSNASSIDEQITCDYLLSHTADLFVNIIDAVNLERNLYLTLQLLTMGVPIVVVVNMLDIAQKRQIYIDLKKLSAELGCTVLGIVANKQEGIQELKKKIIEDNTIKKSFVHMHFPKEINEALCELKTALEDQHPPVTKSSYWFAQQLLLNDVNAKQKVNKSVLDLSQRCQQFIEEHLKEEPDILFADLFFSHANRINHQVVSQNPGKTTLTDVIDKIVLNRFLGIPIFLGIMYTMFLFAINLSGAFQDFFDIASDTLFVQGFAQFLQHHHAPDWLVAILAFGAGKGINTTVSFIPVIGGMFLFLSLLESSGYMARAAYIVDRLMQTIGLPGKSFVPMIVGFGCNVPAIMAARTLENPRDRILTILMSPFMSCGARLAIFAVFTAAFFPSGGQNVVFALYLIGIMTAVLTAFILRKTLLKEDLSPFILELPPYHLPKFRALMFQTWHRLKDFIFRAGKLIIPLCMLIGSLNAIHTNQKESLLAIIGKTATPLFTPLGVQENNWPATVGLVTGVLAKEVIVGTLNTLYLQEGGVFVPTQAINITDGLKAASQSVVSNLANLKNSLINPVLASVPDHSVNRQVYGIMCQRFGDKISAFAYLLFVLLYFPCISATAAMQKELNSKWTLFSVLWTTGIAYCIAVLFYQVMTINLHPLASMLWILGIITTFLLTLYSLQTKKRMVLV